MINKNIYIVSYKEFKEQLLPLLMRKDKILELLQALITPLVSLYNIFFAYKNKAIYKTDHNASITLLQKMLNDGFDNIERRIYINNAQIRPTEHYYDLELGDSLVFYNSDKGTPVWFFDKEVFNVYRSDFTVFLPAEIKPSNPENENRLLTKIKSELDYYKIYGTKYAIVWLN